MTRAAGASSCRVCAGELRGEREGLYDDRYGFPDRFNLSRCISCGHRQLQAAFSPAALENLYTSYYPRRAMSVEDWQPHDELGAWQAWWRGERAYAFRWVPRGVRVLDIGCGFGQTLGYHRARGCEVRGVEADGNAARVAERFGFDIKIGLFEAADYPPESFDYVTMDQVIEHVTDPVTTLTGVARVLAPGGTAILSTPNAGGFGAAVFGRRWINWHTPYHLQFFSRRSMRIAAQRAGLHVARTKTIASSEWLFYQWMSLLAFPAAGEGSAFWAPHPMKDRLMQRRGVRAARLVHRAGFDHVVTRAADLLGLGDNFVFFLRKAP